jgi:hypothetical protein
MGEAPVPIGLMDKDLVGVDRLARASHHVIGE